MLGLRIKIVLFLFIVGMTIAGVLTLWRDYWKEIQNERQVEQTFGDPTKRTTVTPKVDLGLVRYEAIKQKIKEGEVAIARENLYRMLKNYGESSAAGEARQMLGLINLQQFYAQETIDKLDQYEIQSKDSWIKLAEKLETTTDDLKLVNGWMGEELQPGDKLKHRPLSFVIYFKHHEKKMELRQVKEGREIFFKEYNLTASQLPSGLVLPLQTKIKTKTATQGQKIIVSSDLNYIVAEKMIVLEIEGLSLKNEARLLAQKNNAQGQQVLESGFFLKREHLQEVFALVRNGTKVLIVR
jgi:hypothetical protein